MAHLQYQNQPSVFQVSASLRDLYWRNGYIKQSCRNIPFQNLWLHKRNTRLMHLSTCSTSSSDQQVTDINSPKLNLEPTYQGNNNHNLLQFACLVMQNNWQVRRMVETEEEMRKVASVQAEAFHEPLLLFNDLFFNFFQAEVLSGLLYRLRNSAPDRYACLVAESLTCTPGSQKELVGVVDVTVFRDESVLQHLPGAVEYLYVSGIAVLNKFRRQKVATALLKACEVVAAMWGFEYLVLRAYEDDYGARKLYSNAGYRLVSADSPWLTRLIGRRRRVLMIKRAEHLQ